MRFWKRDEEGLERRLRASRPEPRDEFVHSLARRLRQPGRPRLALRLGLAAALTAVFVVALASVGGFSQSTHAIGSALNITRVSGKDDGDGNRPDKDQYKDERKECQKAAQGDHQAAVRTAEQNREACRDQARQDFVAARRACGNDKKCVEQAEQNYELAKRRCEHQFHQALRDADAALQAALQICKERFPKPNQT